MSKPEFHAWPKTHRLYSSRGVSITEKIDGTNAAVIIEEHRPDDGWTTGWFESVWVGDSVFHVSAQSRKRLISPDDDNFGFAAWVRDNAQGLVENLGPGYHYGEWRGGGIQRGYGLVKDDKRFSLFNAVRWGQRPEWKPEVPGLGVVPELARCTWEDGLVETCVDSLEQVGSWAAPGFMKPEGVVVYHIDARVGFKYTPWDGDGARADKAATRG